MKMIKKSNSHYKRPNALFNGHLETIYPALFRKTPEIIGKKISKRIDTSDGDFLDSDWYLGNNAKLVIIQHGLEGASDRPYMLGMAKIFRENDYDVCCWNFRGCSKEMNRKPFFYHSGATYDLDTIVQEALKNYSDITLVGFSLGGNLTLKYLGETIRDPKIKRAIAISAPLELSSCADNLDTLKCIIYQQRFLKNLRKKVKKKELLIPGSMKLENLHKTSSIRAFDEYFTAPLHGFDGANDYYKKNSSKYFLEGIQIPTLILNASNDPLLTPENLKNKHHPSNIEYEITKHGGHVGFAEFNEGGYYWSEKRALNFCETY